MYFSGQNLHIYMIQAVLSRALSPFTIQRFQSSFLSFGMRLPLMIITIFATCFVNTIFAMKSHRVPCHKYGADTKEDGDRMRVMVNGFVETLSGFVTISEIDISSFQMSTSKLHESFSQIVSLGEGLLQSGERYHLIGTASALFQTLNELIASKSKYVRTGDISDKVLYDAQKLYARCLVLKHAREKSESTGGDNLFKYSELASAY